MKGAVVGALVFRYSAIVDVIYRITFCLVHMLGLWISEQPDDFKPHPNPYRDSWYLVVESDEIGK